MPAGKPSNRHRERDVSYSDRQMREISTCPERLRGYFWRVATNARQLAHTKRTRIQRGYMPDVGELTPETLERFADTIIENIDEFVASTFTGPHLLKEER